MNISGSSGAKIVMAWRRVAAAAYQRSGENQ
jgi:hypothetical protein